MWPGKGFGDEEVGPVWDLGHRGNIPQSPGSTAAGEDTHTHTHTLQLSNNDSSHFHFTQTSCINTSHPLCLSLSAHEASEGCSYDVAACAHCGPDRNDLLQSAWALRDPQGVLRRTFSPRPAVEPPPESRGPLPKTGEEKKEIIQGGWFGASEVVACASVPMTAETSMSVAAWRSS